MTTNDGRSKVIVPAKNGLGSWNHRFEYEQLFADIRPRLLQLASLRGVPGEAIEDVVQETLLRAWQPKSRLHYAVRALRLTLQEMGVTR